MPVNNIHRIEIIGIRTDDGRKEFGDIDELAESMKAEGQLVPIGVTQNGELLHGRRRLAAAKKLGWTTIEAKVYPEGVEKEVIEYAENSLRLDYSPLEKYRLYERIKSRIDQGAISRPAGQRVRDIAAKMAGFNSSFTPTVIEKLVASGDGDMLEDLNSGTISPRKANQARKKKAQSKTKEASTKEEEAKTDGGETQAAIKDPRGNNVPDELLDVFMDAALPGIARAIATAKTQLRSINKWNPYLLEETFNHLERAKQCVINSFAHALCKSCQGARCQECLNCGWVPEWKLKEQEMFDNIGEQAAAVV